MIQKLQIHALEECLLNNITILETIVNKYGILKSNEHNSDDNNLRSDFLFLCLTKGLRSLNAAHFLAEKGFFEDIFILLRSTYESYLHMSFIKKNPKQIHRFTTIKMGIRMNEFKHPKNKKGDDLQHKIIDPFTGKELIVEISLKKISKNTLHPADGKIYDLLYSYLSEYSHINIIALGNYVSYESKRFQIKSEYENKIFQTIILSLFISWLLLDILSSFSEFNKKSHDEIKEQHLLTGMYINNYITMLETYDEKLEKMKSYILERLHNI